MIEKILEIANKFIPNQQDKENFMIEAMKLENENFKDKKGIITKAFHLVFPFATFVLICMYVVEFYLRVNQYLNIGDWSTVSIVPTGLELIVIIFLSLLMPRKLLEPIIKLVIQHLENKIKYEKFDRK